MAFDSELSGAFEEMEEEFGNKQITWRNTDYLCTVDLTTRTVTMNALGNPVSIHTRVWIRTALFGEGERPQFGHSVRQNGVALEVGAITLLSDSVLELTLSNPAGRR